MPRIVRVGPEYEVLGLSGNYREAELILNISNEALRSLLVAVVVLWRAALPWRCCVSRFLSVELRCRDEMARDRNKQERNHFGQVF
jgi:hypothetical protein